MRRSVSRSSREYSPSSEWTQDGLGNFSDGCDIAFPPPAQDEGSAAALDHLPVNLGPKGGEVVHRGDERKDHHEPDRHACDGMHRKEECFVNRPLQPAVCQDYGHYRYDLNHHLELTQIAGLDRKTLGGCNRTQTTDEELAPNDDNRDPGWHQTGIELHQRYERRCDE